MAQNRLNKQPVVHIIANAASLDKKSAALSGSDRIFIEFARQWVQRGLAINIYVWEEGMEMCRNLYGLKGVNFHLWPAKIVQKHEFIVGYFYRILSGFINALKLKINQGDIVYSASDFWQDSIPAIILKLRNKNVKWIAGFYLFAPKPWQEDSPYKRKRWVTGLFYWLTQLPVYWFIRRYADMIFVTSEPDIKKFVTKKKNKDRVLVIRGGVDIKPSVEYLKLESVVPRDERKYDACFVGRFHPQKGVLELIDIWKLVCDKRPRAKLAMIGNGVLETAVKNKVAELRLSSNIDLMGFKDGEEKYAIFKQSKIIVHPATYDSGGMAAAEAMAWGLPGVSFDLEALKTYYPKGMIKTPCCDLKLFAENIIKLLEDKGLYNTIKEDAIDSARHWDWDKRAEDVFRQVASVCL